MPFPWLVGFDFTDFELGMELGTVTSGISGFDD